MPEVSVQSFSPSSWWTTIQRLVAGEDVYSELCSLEPLDRIRMVKHGLPARMLTLLADDLSVSREKLYGWLGIPRTTANRKVKEEDLLSQDESERALGLACLIGRVQRIVEESGDFVSARSDEFDAARWIANWLEEPSHALGGWAPGEFLDTADGRGLVSGLIVQMQSGAYA